MKTFIEINKMVRYKGYGRFLSYLLVNKALEVKINNPDIIYLEVDFN